MPWAGRSNQPLAKAGAHEDLDDSPVRSNRKRGAPWGPKGRGRWTEADVDRQIEAMQPTWQLERKVAQLLCGCAACSHHQGQLSWLSLPSTPSAPAPLSTPLPQVCHPKSLRLER